MRTPKKSWSNRKCQLQIVPTKIYAKILLMKNYRGLWARFGWSQGPKRERQFIYSRLWRHSTARGFSTSLVTVGPSKVKGRKSVLFTEGTPEVKIKNTC